MFDAGSMGVPRDKTGVGKGCDRFVQNYRPNLEVVRAGDRFCIVQKFNAARPLGAFSVYEEILVPVLFINQALYPEYAWIEALERNRFKNIKRDIDASWEKHEQTMKKIDELGEQAAELTYPYFRKTYGAVNMEGVRRENPYDRTKKLQDKLGREIR